MDRTDIMRRARTLRWASLSAALAACAAALAAVSLTGWSLFQPDTRYMVAIGRWIIENGKLPTSDPLTLHEGLAYICQQWPLCIAAAAIFDTFGEAGIKCAAAMLDMAAAATVWACTLDRGRTGAVHAAASAARTVTEASADAALAALEAAGAESGDAVICDIDVGSELELAGLRPLLDTRAELFCPELNGGTDAGGQARSVLTGDAAAIGGTGAGFAVFPSGAYPALEKALTGLGYAGIYDDGCFAAYAGRPVP